MSRRCYCCWRSVVGWRVQWRNIAGRRLWWRDETGRSLRISDVSRPQMCCTVCTWLWLGFRRIRPECSKYAGLVPLTNYRTDPYASQSMRRSSPCALPKPHSVAQNGLPKKGLLKRLHPALALGWQQSPLTRQKMMVLAVIACCFCEEQWT